MINVGMSYDNAKPNCEHVEVCVVRHRSQDHNKTHVDAHVHAHDMLHMTCCT